MCCPVTFPSAPEKWVVTTEKSCSPRPMSLASSIAYERRNFCGHSGQGVRSSGRCSGGSGSSSSCVTDSAPSRIELPTQSAPVSPPPTTTTCLPAAVITGRSGWATVGSGPSSPATQRLRTYR